MSIIDSKTIQLTSLRGASDPGGWIAECKFLNEPTKVSYGRNVQLYAKLEAAGVLEEDKLAIDGYMIPRTASWNHESTNSDFTVRTTDFYLEIAGLQGIYLVDAALPTNIHQINGLQIADIVEHILQDHTNVTTATTGGWVSTSGIDLADSTSINVMRVNSSNSIWTTLAELGNNEFYIRYMTKEDNFVYKMHPQFETILPSVQLAITEDMLIGEPEITYRDRIQVDQIQLYALTDDGEVLRSDYPANVASDGRREKIANIRCNSQSRLNVLAKRKYDWDSRSMDVRLFLNGAYGIWLEMYDRVSVTYNGNSFNATTGFIEWAEKKFYVRDININIIDPFGAVTELILDEENVEEIV